MMLLLCIFSGMNFGMNSEFWSQFWYEKNQPSVYKHSEFNTAFCCQNYECECYVAHSKKRLVCWVSCKSVGLILSSHNHEKSTKNKENPINAKQKPIQID